MKISPISYSNFYAINSQNNYLSNNSQVSINNVAFKSSDNSMLKTGVKRTMPYVATAMATLLTLPEILKNCNKSRVANNLYKKEGILSPHARELKKYPQSNLRGYSRNMVGGHDEYKYWVLPEGTKVLTSRGPVTIGKNEFYISDEHGNTFVNNAEEVLNLNDQAVFDENGNKYIEQAAARMKKERLLEVENGLKSKGVEITKIDKTARFGNILTLAINGKTITFDSDTCYSEHNNFLGLKEEILNTINRFEMYKSGNIDYEGIINYNYNLFELLKEGKI